MKKFLLLLALVALSTVAGADDLCLAGPQFDAAISTSLSPSGIYKTKASQSPACAALCTIEWTALLYCTNLNRTDCTALAFMPNAKGQIVITPTTTGVWLANGNRFCPASAIAPGSTAPWTPQGYGSYGTAVLQIQD